MSPGTQAIVAIAFSLAGLVLLALHDPKRLRSIGAQRTSPLSSSSVRRALAVLVVAPGLVLAVLGAWHPFLIWLGAVCVLGWLVSLVLATLTTAERSPRS
jgi:hypothetical protein